VAAITNLQRFLTQKSEPRGLRPDRNLPTRRGKQGGKAINLINDDTLSDPWGGGQSSHAISRYCEPFQDKIQQIFWGRNTPPRTPLPLTPHSARLR